MPAEVFGRDPELRAIATFLDRLRTGPGALVLAGEAGAGKTTLLRAATAHAAERGLTVLQTAPAHGDLRLAFAGLADLVEPRLDDVLDDLPEPQARALRVALLLDDAPLPHPPDPRTIAAAFRSYVRALSRSGPVLLIIDDAQWLDPASEAAIGFSMRRLEREPVGLLCAQRTDSAGRDLPLELGHARMSTEVIPVGGLRLGGLHRMLNVRLGGSFSHSVLRQIESGSGGNPFIALEIGRALLRRGGRTSALGVLPVPATLSGLVSERLGSLPADVIGALQLVAVMPGVPVEAYLACGGDGSALDPAIGASVLEETAGRLQFAHPLLAAAVSAAIPPTRKRALHAAAAGVAALPEERARHQALATAGRSETVAAQVVDAATAAAARGAPATAAELYELSASLTPEGTPEWVRRRLDAARQLALAGDARAARALLEELVEVMPPGPDRSDALSQLGPLREDDIAAATEVLTRALAEAGADPARTCVIRMGLSDAALHGGDQERALAEAEQALADAEHAGDPALLASALAQAYCYAFIVGAEPDEGWLARALELEQTVGRASLRTQPSFVAGYCHMAQGRLAEAETELQRVLDFATADGVEYTRADALYRLALVAVRRGDAHRAARLAADGLETAEQLDLPQVISGLVYACGRAALHLGHVDEVREHASRGAVLAAEAGDRPYVISFEALLASLDLALGEHASAAARYRPLVNQGRQLGLRLFVSQGIAADAVEALAMAGATEEAEALLAEVTPLARDGAAAAAMARCRGAIAAGRHDLAGASAELTVAICSDDLSPLDRGRALLLLGAVQRRQKQRAEARATLTRAMAIFTDIDAPLWRARVSDELSRIGGRSRGPEDLSETERRVAELVARGLSNREVAAALFVTVRAVESTLTKTYAKLGVRSRTELASRIRSGQEA